MNAFLRHALVLLASFAPGALLAADKNCGCSCCTGKPVCCCSPEAPSAAAKRYPLRGVVTAVHADRSALMVKHEEIPGLMRPMTMLFKVDAATLGSVKKGQTITALLSREGDEWLLHDVKVESAKRK